MSAAPQPHDAEASLGDLLDDPDFHELDLRFGKFNLFEAVGGVRSELRHSNFLAFLLSPTRSHGMGGAVLEKVLRAILEEMPAQERPIRTLQVALGDLDDAIVHRERDNIDLMIEVTGLDLVVTIENKVGAAAGDGQLARYKELVDSRFPKAKRLYVFLTPDGIEPDSPGWVAFSYRRLAEVLAGAADLDSAGDGPRLILNHYVEMLRRHVVPDDDLRDLALRLYQKHREAFDFVFEVRPQPRGLLEDLRSRILSVQGLIEDRPGANTGNIFRFLPTQWESLDVLRCDPTKWSRTGRGLLFEAKITPNTGRVQLILILGPCDPNIRKGFYERAMKRTAFKNVVKPMGLVTAQVYGRDLLTPVQAQSLDFDQQTANVSFAWSDFQGTELMTLITEVVEIAKELEASLEGAA